jgi:hypothetical protein
MFQKFIQRLTQLTVLTLLACCLTACDTQVYGSIGVSSYRTMGNTGVSSSISIGSGGRVGGSVSIGGRIR